MSQDNNKEDLERYFSDPEYRRQQAKIRKEAAKSGTISNDPGAGSSSAKPAFSQHESSESSSESSDAGSTGTAGPTNSGSAGSGGGSARDNGNGPPLGSSGSGWRFFDFSGGLTWANLLKGTAIVFLVLLIAGGSFFVYLLQGLPSLEELENPRTDMASFVKSRDGEILDKYFTENRTAVRYDDISSHVIDALVATEDHRYYGHWGMDMYRTLAIPYHIMRGDPQGGSTISQQLARNLYRQIGREVSVRRKLREILTAIQVERNYTKKEIIEMYLNTVEFSNSAFGIETAALTHFDKPASDLNVLEAATLIGSLKAVSLYNPRRNPERAQMRRNVVLSQMAKHGFIEHEELVALRDEPIDLEFNPPFREGQQTRYFGEYVRQQIQEWAQDNGYDLYRDGLVIHTTIDSRMQRYAQLALQEQVVQVQENFESSWTSSGSDDYMDIFWDDFPRFLDSFIRETEDFREKVAEGYSPDDALEELKRDEAFVDSVKKARTRIEGGFVGIDPSSGEVLAWVGGTDYGEIQRDNVYQSRRQTGSTFKPFVYALAIDNGYRPHHKFSKYPVSFFDESGQRWSPRDPVIDHLDDTVPLREALARSLNNVTVRLLPELSGNPDTNRLEDLYTASNRIADLAQSMGINRQEMIREPSIALGTAESSLLELTSAYATFANQGVYIEPRAISRIEDQDGNILAEFHNEHQEEVISPETAYYVTDMMRDVIRQGTGRRLLWAYGLDQDMAGKTGTTNRSADAWFVGMTPQVVMGSWVGGEDRRIRFPEGSSVGQGSQSALPTVGRFIQYMREDENSGWLKEAFEQPQGMIMEVEDDEVIEEEDRPSRITW